MQSNALPLPTRQGAVAEGAEADSVCFSGLDPALASLGQLIGVLQKGSDADSFCLNANWFGDPITNLKTALRENPGEIAGLMTELLGSAAGQAMGLPVKDAALLGTWYPLITPDPKAARGLYIVNYESAGDQVFGIGVLGQFDVPTADPVITLEAWGLVPILKMGADGVAPVLTEPGFPMSVGLAVEGAEDTSAKRKPLFELEGISFDGVKANVLLDVAAAIEATKPAITADVVVLRLQLPGEPAPKDMSLADLASLSSLQIQNTVASLFVGALSQISKEAADEARYLLPILGINGTVPGQETALPELDWGQLLKIAVTGKGDVAQPFRDWFGTLVADPNLLGTWLVSLGGAMGAPAPMATGAGSRANPLAVELTEITGVGALSFTMGSTVTQDGTRQIYPGLLFGADPKALGTSDAVLRLTAKAELAEFSIGPATVSFGAPSSLDFSLGVALTDKTLGKPLVSAHGYGVGSIQAGVALSAASLPLPQMQLVELITPDGSHDNVNLLNPSEVAREAEEVLPGLILAQLKSMLGIGTPDAIPFADGIAALIGVTKPAVKDGIWPPDLAPPFSEKQIAKSIFQPVDAIGTYYRDILTSSETINGRKAFSYIVEEIAGLLQEAQTGTVSVSVTGGGTPQDPWAAALTLGDTTLPAHLTAFTAPATQTGHPITQLVIGMTLAPQLTLAGTKVEPTVTFDLVSVDLPDAGSEAQLKGIWAPLIAAGIRLPEGFTSPSMGGAVFSIGPSEATGSFSRESGLSLQLIVSDPVLTIDGQTIKLGQSLDLADAKALQALVEQEVAAFQEMITGLLGVALLKTGTRPGLAVAGAMGLLPEIDKAAAFPKGLTWPKIAPLTLDSFADPWPALRTQLGRALADDATAGAVLSLIGWSLETSQDDAAMVPGSLDYGDPFRIALPGSFADMLMWASSPGQSLGLGLGRDLSGSFTLDGATIETLTRLRLDALEFDLATGKLTPDNTAPGIGITTTLSRKGKLLVDAGAAGSLESLTLGLRVAANGAGKAVVVPIVTLTGATLPGETQPSTLTFEQITDAAFAPRALSAVAALLNQAVDIAARAAAGNTLFDDGYALLSALGLAQPRNGDGDPYGINPDGWQGLIADPEGFAISAFETLLLDTTAREKFTKFIGDLLGVELPTIDTAILDVLSALGVLGPADLGYPLRLDTLVALIRNPVEEIVSLVRALLADTAAVSTLTSQLASLAKPVQAGPVQMAVASGTKITFSIDPALAPVLAGILRVQGSLTLDLATPSLSVDLGARIVQLGLGPDIAVGFHPAADGPATMTSIAGIAPDFTFGIGFGDGTRPAPDPLILYAVLPTGTPQPPDLKTQLARIVPAYALSTLGTLVLEDQVLAKSPLAQEVFTGLGLAEQVDGVWRMPSLLGLAEDPKGWLLSKGVLGTDGQFDVAGFARWLGGLPKVDGPSGLSVTPQKDGVGITGLPYGFGISLTGTDDTATLALGSKKITIADGSAALEDLMIGVKLGPNAAPGVIGALRIEATPGSIDPIFADIAYDDGFSLSVGQGTATWTGLISAHDKEEAQLALQLLPFQGFGSLVEQAARQLPAKLISEVMPVLMDALRDAGAKDFADALQTAGTDLDALALVRAISSVPSFTLEAVETAALDWLKTRLSDANAPATADAVKALLALVLGDTVTTSGGLVLYKPSMDLPLTFEAGIAGAGDDAQIGLWAELDLPDLGRIRPRVQRTGIGIPRTGKVIPKFSFGVDVTVAFEGDTGPQLALALTDAGEGLPGLALSFDPLGSVSGGAASPLARQLLPEFFPDTEGDGSTLPERFEGWALQCLTEVVPRYVAAVLLNQGAVSTWLGDPLFGSAGGPTPADVLQGAKVITKADGRYALAPISTFKTMDPLEFAADFLRGLLAEELRILQFGPDKTGELWIGPNSQDANAYGLRVKAPGLKVPKLDFVTLQLGADNTDWIAAAGGPDGLKPGIGVYLPIPDVNGKATPEFDKFELNFVNLGLDFTGKAGQPLVNMARFQLGGVSPRAFVDLNLNGSNAPKIEFGVGAGLDDIAISVAPANAVPGSGGNAVAKNLLGSGDKDGSADNTSATNPAFTVFGAYAGKPFVELTRAGKPANPIIIPVQRSFGPLNVVDVGFGWDQGDAKLDLIFDGGLSLAGLEASVQGLSVGIPVKTITDLDSYTLGLQGLDLSFRGGSVTIEGGLEKFDGPPISYEGALVVQAAGFGITALGAYSLLPTTADPDGPTAPSLFVFGALQAPLGGVPAFFVTGVAAGFGINRSVTIPPVGEVQDFPLLPGKFGAGTSLKDAMSALHDVVKPDLGQYWLAAGLTFTSFELIDGMALIFVQFGRRFQLDLVGLASAPLPKGLPKGEALAYVELALKATVIPEEGFISVEAQLTPNSYVLAQPCKLTGGFAFLLWVKDIKTPDGTPISAGQFVVTLGGYHPAFKKPSYYPDVPRLGLEWLIDVSVGKVTISGGTYFALVPTAIMAGGYLKVLFEAGPLRAWLDAAANFIIQWKPFYYEVEIGVSIGVAFKTTIGGVSITLSISLGADLILEGPPTHGKAHVSWFIISFTIPIGEASNATTSNLLKWDAFEQGFLPAAGTDDGSGPPPVALMAMAETGSAADDSTPRQPLKLAVVTGRLGGGNTQDESAAWLVRAVPFSLRIDTVIPASEVSFAATETTLAGKAIGIRPMGEKTISAPIKITVTDPSGSPVDLDARGVGLDVVTGGAPNAVWSKAKLDNKQAPQSDDLVIADSVMGTLLNASSYLLVGTIPAFPLTNLKYDLAKRQIHLPLADPAKYGPAAAIVQTSAITRMMQTIMAAPVVARRNAAYATFRDSDLDAPADPSLTVMANAADVVVQAPPVLAHPGVYQAAVPVQSGKVPRSAPAAPKIVPMPEVHAPRLVAVVRSHALTRPAVAAHGALETPLHRVVTRVTAAASADSGKAPLSLGQSALWAMDVRTQHEVIPAGTGRLRALCLDADEAMLADRIIDVAGEGRSLPEGTRHVLFQPLADDHSAVGWQLDSPLFQITDHLAAGDGFTLRTQNAIRRRKTSRRAVEAEDMLLDNRVTGADGKLSRGWVQTIFPGQITLITVVTDLAPDQAAARLRVSALRHAVPGLAATHTLDPVDVEARPGGSAARFLVPGQASEETSISIVTHLTGEADGTVLAVLGHDTAPETFAAPRATCLAAMPRQAAKSGVMIALRPGTGAHPLAPGVDDKPEQTEKRLEP
ncbi:hypothetical protein A8B78_11805 [Jannaschia sp. EhC01]|nr:hypothetical protein A8B78_11805 [Jannaschia sp. EhC01]